VHATVGSDQAKEIKGKGGKKSKNNLKTKYDSKENYD
jgi:hypothetical protein